MRNAFPWLLLLSGLASPLQADVDLAARYPATIDRSDPPRPLEWTATRDDVWRLSAFNYSQAEDLNLALGPSTVVFGVHEKNVLWAAVFPDAPGTLRSSGKPTPEKIASCWIRLHPARVDELFPKSQVAGPGDERFARLAKRMCAWKIRGSMQSGDLPVVPQREWLIFDLDTADAVRRFYFADTTAGTVRYEGAFEKRPLPPLEAIDPADATRTFDQVWSEFDREYAMFGLRPEVDWKKLHGEFRPQAAAARSSYELACVLGDMLASLKDLHVFVRVGDEFIPGFNRPRPLNASFDGSAKLVGGFKEKQTDMAWARTPDDIGYINIYRLADKDLPKQVDQALESLADTWALIIDLRFNGGGNEDLACKIAARFTDSRRVYSVNQYRSGPEHGDLGKRHERTIEPRDKWLYRAPVLVLIGRKTMSSAESFALMLAQCPQATTMGDRTAGSSGNPKLLTLPGKIAVNLPRWIDLDPSGKPIDTVGVAPAIANPSRESDFSPENDAVLEAALKRLREKPAGERKPGKRE
ncbi:MAG: S41 family peptidase [Planctomycetes bacterium]|nr:S41 family peptidase [Planctomycetota bacterium]